MSVVYNGEHSIDFWNLNDQEALCVNSWDDLHLIPASRPYVANPEVMLQSVNIPNTNRRIDLTASLTEGRTYNSRQGEWEFIIDHDKWPDWATCYRHLVQYFHGFKMAARLKDHDLERMYKGRISVQSYAPNNDYSRIVLRYIFESGRVTDYGDLNLVFNVAWVDWSGGLFFQSKFSWNDTPSYPGAPSSVTFEPSISSVKSNQIYREVTAVRIVIVSPPSKTTYWDGETLVFTGIDVVAYGNDGRPWTGDGSYPNGHIPFNELSFSTSKAALPESGDKQGILVTWHRPGDRMALSDDFQITVKEVPYSIRVTTNPTKLEYEHNETIDYTGIVVTAYKKNGEIWTASGYSGGIIPFSELILNVDKASKTVGVDTQSIPVKWKRPGDKQELSSSFDITVILAEHISVIVLPTKSEYSDGDTVDYTGIQVAAYRSDGRVWTGGGTYPNGIIPFNELIFTVTKIVAPEEGSEVSLPVKWSRINDSVELETSFNVEVVDGPYYISVIVLPNNISYVQNETINYTGIKVQAFDKNGNVWKDESWSDEFIPYNNLIFPTTKAPAPASGVKSIIPVEWKAPNNTVLETTFEINVGIVIYNRQYMSSTFSTFDGYNVVKISNSQAFTLCSNLTSVDFPICSYLGSWAFHYCSSLVSISFPVCRYVMNGAFNCCLSLVSISFPVCSYVGNSAFGGCSSLVSVSFPVCSYVGYSAFYNCSSLVSANFPVCSYVGSYAFENCSSLVSANFPVCSYVSGWAFANCSSLVSISFPVCSYVGYVAFYNCSSLVSISFPVCSYVSGAAFENCSSLVSANFPVCSYVGYSAFANCSSLVSISFPVCSYVGGCAFENCSSLVSANFPVCSYVSGWAFNRCSSLVSISFPVCGYLSSYAFYNCSSLVSVSFPVCSYVDYSAFANCLSLVSANFPVCNYVGNCAFQSCSSLQYLTIGGSSVISYNGGIGLGNTPMSAKSIWSSAISSYIYVPYPWTESNPIEFGSIYVPASLINDYMTASGWSAYSSRFAAI